MDSVLSYSFDISTPWGVWLHLYSYGKSVKAGSDNTTAGSWPHCLHMDKQREREGLLQLKEIIGICLLYRIREKTVHDR